MSTDRVSDLPIFLFSAFWSSFPGVNRRNVNLTTHILLVSRLRMSGAVPLAPYIFIAYIGTTLPLPNEILFIIHTYCRSGWCTVWNLYLRLLPEPWDCGFERALCKDTRLPLFCMLSCASRCLATCRFRSECRQG